MFLFRWFRFADNVPQVGDIEFDDIPTILTFPTKIPFVDFQGFRRAGTTVATGRPRLVTVMVAP